MAVAPLRALITAGFEIPVVITRPDKRRGRGSGASPSPVKAVAAELGVHVSHDLSEATSGGAEVGVVVAYGRIIPVAVLEALPMVNLHFSLLPRWRGAAPVERAVLAGDRRTGVCVMEVEEGLDTGGVYARAEVELDREISAADLRERLVAVGTDLLVDTLRTGLVPPEPQTGEPTYADKLSMDDVRLDWTLPAVDLHRRCRVGGAWTTFRGRRLKVHRAVPSAEPGVGRPGELHGATVTAGSGTLTLLEVQPEGKGVLRFEDWRNGARPRPGEELGSSDS